MAHSLAFVSPPSLPTPRSSLVGRAREIAAARALLLDEAVPLLTLTGPGGVGKTRLALAIAHEIAGEFADGAAFVDLAPIRDPALVLSAIAKALDVREGGDRPLADVLAAFLQSRQVLLVLDNVEHLLMAAPAVSELLLAAPALQVLATSRAPLRIHGEHEFPVSPLALPVSTEASPADLARIDAVALLQERARAVNPGLVPTDEDLRVMAEVCRRLDGLPLAIELAAARLKILSPPALLARLSYRLRLLTGGPRDVPDRQRTMRDTIAWSYDLLSLDEQALFRSLAVFAGGCTLDAAEVVGGSGNDTRIDVLDGLAALVDGSLLSQVADFAEEPRYRMLESFREFGLEQLDRCGEEAEIRGRHAAYFLRLAEEAEPHLLLPGQESWQDRLAADHDNLRAALAWLEQTGECEAMLRLAGSLDRFWFVRSFNREGRDWMERALKLAGEHAPAALRAKALGGAGRLAIYQGDYLWAEPLIQQSLELWRDLGDREQIATNLIRLGLAYEGQERYPEAAAVTEEAFALYEEIGDTVAAAAPLASIAMNNLGAIALAQGDYGRAAEYLAEALARERALGYPWSAGQTRLALGHLARALGNMVEAAAHYWEGLELARTHGDRWMAARALAGLADVARASDQPERAARLLGAATGLDEAIGGSIHPYHQKHQERTRAAARAALGEARFGAAWAAGRALSAEAAFEEAAEVARSTPVARPDTLTARAPAHGLSPREVEVLRLIAQHRTDREIAAALFVSPRTIQTHVERIRAKLGVENRREAAATAVRLGLV